MPPSRLRMFPDGLTTTRTYRDYRRSGLQKAGSGFIRLVEVPFFGFERFLVLFVHGVGA